MDVKDNGGLAFPIGSGDLRDPCGMTLRDYFAGQAIIGILSDPGGPSMPGFASRDAYRIADAMLAERNKEAGE